MNNHKKIAGILVVLWALAAFASITGTISGIIMDPAGAVISGATVKATNVQTGVQRTLTTDATDEKGKKIHSVAVYDKE